MKTCIWHSGWGRTLFYRFLGFIGSFCIQSLCDQLLLQSWQDYCRQQNIDGALFCWKFFLNEPFSHFQHLLSLWTFCMVLPSFISVLLQAVQCKKEGYQFSSEVKLILLITFVDNGKFSDEHCHVTGAPWGIIWVFLLWQ